MSNPSVFYRLEVITRCSDAVFGDSTISVFDSLERAKNTGRLFKEKLGLTAPVKIYRVICEEVKDETV